MSASLHQHALNAKDGVKIYFSQWDSLQNPVGTVIIIHGMAEHSQRYAPVAHAFNQAGFRVIAPDMRGHGQTGMEMHHLGFFANRDGWRVVLGDLVQLIKHVHTQFPNQKIILLGHSMGSYLAQHCAMLLSPKIDALILSAASFEYRLSLFPGLVITRLFCSIGLSEHPAGWLQNLIFGGYNRVFTPTRTPFDWLASDPKVVDAYIADPHCGFICSYSFFYDLFWGIWHTTIPAIRSIQSHLPILFISGAQDPMGKMGDRVTQLVHRYRHAGFECVASKLYPRSRHEVLNDQEKNEVLHDILEWISTQIHQNR